MTDKPMGGVVEYDLLNTLVDFNDQVISDRGLAIHAETGWGLCRCRMAAIIAHTASERGWRSDLEHRAVLWAKHWNHQ